MTLSHASHSLSTPDQYVEAVKGQMRAKQSQNQMEGLLVKRPVDTAMVC